MNCSYSKNIANLIFLLVCLWTAQSSYAQKIENIRHSLVNNEIHLTYDLVFNIENAEFNITVFYGDQNSQSQKLTNARGEFGSETILPGIGKEIIIEDISHLKPFIDNLTFRIDPKLMYMPVHEIVVSGNKFKRGKSIPISWQGGKSGEKVQLSLLRGEEEVYTTEHTIFAFSLEGLREAGFDIKNNVKRGDNYSIRLTDAKNNNVITPEFSIRPRIPMVIKIGGILVVGGIVAILVGGTDGGGESPDQGSSIPDLPDGAHPGGG